VRYLLIGAATGLRRATALHGTNDRFSLDGQIPDTADTKMKIKKKKADDKPTGNDASSGENGTAEHLIAEELGACWRIRQHWGPRERDYDRDQG
jgi:hypothetical protein